MEPAYLNAATIVGGDPKLEDKNSDMVPLLL